MKRNRRTLWFVATGLSLSAFSFAAGFGIRNLASMTFGGRLPVSAARLANYTQVASAAAQHLAIYLDLNVLVGGASNGPMTAAELLASATVLDGAKESVCHAAGLQP